MSADTGQWVLVDWYSEGTGENRPARSVPCRTTLETILEAYKHQESRILHLKRSDGTIFHIGVGPGVGFVQVFRQPGKPDDQIAIASPTVVNEPLPFVSDYQPCYYPPRYLLPIHEIIRIVGDIYENGDLPAWVDWETLQ